MKRLFLMALCVFALPCVLLAQQGTGDFPFELNDALVGAIETIFGIGLLGLNQLVKQGMKKYLGFEKWTQLARHASMYLVSLVLAAAVTWSVLSQAHMMAFEPFVLYTAYAWGLSNGWWKGIKELVRKHSGPTFR